MPALKPARWNVWRLMPGVPLWKAVCLSMNIEPELHLRDELVHRPSGRSQLPVEIWDRLKVCEANTGASGRIRPQGGNGFAQLVTLGEVAALLAGGGFSVPEDMRAKPLTVPALDKGPHIDSLASVSGIAAAAPTAGVGLLAAGGGGLAGAGHTVHLTKKRTNSLTAVIELSIENAVDGKIWQSVWDALVRLAAQQDKPPPLLGFVGNEGVKYTSDDDDQPEKYFTREAFRKRFQRRPKSAP